MFASKLQSKRRVSEPIQYVRAIYIGPVPCPKFALKEAVTPK